MWILGFQQIEQLLNHCLLMFQEFLFLADLQLFQLYYLLVQVFRY